MDALLTPYVLSKQRSKSLDVQSMIQRLLEAPEYAERTAHRLLLRHLSGDGNVPSDLTSRGLWEEFGALCNALKVQATPVAPDKRELSFMLETVREAMDRKRRHSRRPTRSRWQQHTAATSRQGSAVRVPSTVHRAGGQPQTCPRRQWQLDAKNATLRDEEERVLRYTNGASHAPESKAGGEQ